MKGRIVIIDDEPEICLLVSKVLTRAGYQTQSTFSGEDGLTLVQPGLVDCLVLDKQLPGMHGGEVMAEARRRVPQLPVVFITAHPEPFSMGEERPTVCLAKPFKNLQVIEEAVAAALESRTGPLARLKNRLSHLVADLAPGRKNRA